MGSMIVQGRGAALTAMSKRDQTLRFTHGHASAVALSEQAAYMRAYGPAYSSICRAAARCNASA